jgi:argininosuccinate lyase
MMTTNLPSGYHRDLQLLKEHLFPAFQQLKNCMDMAALMIENMEVKQGLLEDPKYQFLFSVEEVNKLVNAGVPFRDAYKKIGLAIEAGDYTYSTKVAHTHEGSIGNLCTKEIANAMHKVLNSMNFNKVERQIDQLLNS